MYEQIIDYVVPVSSTRGAEMTKLLENIYRAVNIGMVNEFKNRGGEHGIEFPGGGCRGIHQAIWIYSLLSRALVATAYPLIPFTLPGRPGNLGTYQIY